MEDQEILIVPQTEEIISSPISSSPSSLSTSLRETFKTCLRTVTIEPAVFLWIFAGGLNVFVLSTLILDRSCRIDLGFTSKICDNLTYHKQELDQSQIEANKVLTYKILVENLPSVVLSLFIGSWTDQYGRKPALCFPIFFNGLQNIMLLIFTFFPLISARWVILTGFTGIGGGFAIFLMAAYSFIADRTTVKERTFRISIINGFIFVGMPLGTFSSGKILDQYGYYGVFTTSTILVFMSFFYLLFRIKEEPLQPQNHDESHHQGIFRLSRVKETISALLKKRQQRCVIYLLILSILLISMAFGVNGYYYANFRYDWNEEKYSSFMAIFLLLNCIVSYGFMPLFNYKFNFHDSILGIVCQVSAVTSALIIAFAAKEWIFILGNVTGSMSSFTSVVIRSMITKLIPKEDIGKVFATMGSLESFCPIISTSMFNAIYDFTIDIFPGWMYLALAVLHCVTLIILVIVNFKDNATSEETHSVRNHENSINSN